MRARPGGCPGDCREGCQAGFTLVELLAVLVVMALVAGLAAAQLGARHGGATLEAAAHEIASRCRAARAAAIREASSRAVVIDMASRLVTAGVDVPPFRIAESIGIVSDTSAGERQGKVAGIRFFPNGTSTGGKVRLETGRQAYEVRVNWLTGRVVVERVS
jgi:general secretion pathway protein H